MDSSQIIQFLWFHILLAHFTRQNNSTIMRWRGKDTILLKKTYPSLSRFITLSMNKAGPKLRNGSRWEGVRSQNSNSSRADRRIFLQKRICLIVLGKKSPWFCPYIRNADYISRAYCIDDQKLISLLSKSFTKMFYKPSLLSIDMSYPSIDMIGLLIAMGKMFVTSSTFTGAMRW